MARLTVAAPGRWRRCPGIVHQHVDACSVSQVAHVLLDRLRVRDIDD
jgi:hypothetical protein